MAEFDRGEVEIAAHLCKGCCLCVAACPTSALVPSQFLNRQGYYAISYVGSGCTGCGICFYVCPEPAAITVKRRRTKKASEASPGVASGASVVVHGD